MIYAPVIIPTLNRFDCFKRCLESLELCTGSAFTEVYVGLDFPPSKKYEDGWIKLDAYLREKEKNNSFKKLTVFRRIQNCGVANANGNSAQLRKFVETISDCFIFTEDDNEFSPNFLEFINKGLEKYKDDPNVLAINDYCHYPLYDFKHDDNNFFFHNTDYSAWGYGSWVKKRKKMFEDVRENNFFQRNFHWKIAYEIYRNHGSYRCIQYFAACFSCGWTRMHDGVVSIYMQVKKMNVVVPTISKVRNIGWDKDGQSFEKGMDQRYLKQGVKHTQQIIDSEKTFDYVGNPWTCYDYNNRIPAKRSVNNRGLFTTIIRIAKIIVKYYIKRILGVKK